LVGFVNGYELLGSVVDDVMGLKEGVNDDKHFKFRIRRGYCKGWRIRTNPY
jgi:hypothetical protein